MIKFRKKPKFILKRLGDPERHYIDDPTFHAALADYQKEIKIAKELDKPKPMVTDYLAKSLMTLARKYARKTTHSGYPFIEDMIGDAIVCCLKNLHNFNPLLYKKAFPYFTMVVHNSFVQRILKEQTALYRQYKAILENQKEMVGVAGMEFTQVYGSPETDRKMREFCEKFEKRLAEKRQKQKDRKKAKEQLEGLIEFDDELVIVPELIQEKD